MATSVLAELSSSGPAQVLIQSIWQGMLLTGVAWTGLRLAPRLRASTRFSLWMMVFTLVALLPCFAAGRVLLSSTRGVSPVAGVGLSLNIGWAYGLEAAWLAASLFSLLRLGGSAWDMSSLLRNSTRVPWDGLGEDIQSIVGGPRAVAVRLSDAVDAPSVIGFFRPAVLIPRCLWEDLTPGELKQIVLHEMAHLQRGDDWTNLLQKLLRALCPLNPALFWAERQLCLERERACDDAVLDAAGNAREYATCLTKLAESRMVKRAAVLAPGLWKRHSELAGRVENILHRRRRLGPLLSRGLVAASLFASLFGVVALQRFPVMVSFAASQKPVVAAALPEQTYRDQTQARYQEAVFHPAESPVKPVVQAKAHAPRRTASTGRFRLVALRTEDETGVTFLLFTVEVPRNSRSGQPSLPTPPNWIAFQI